MFEQIKKLCEIKGISIKQLERELGFGNGSLVKAKSIKAERLKLIADYFGVSIADFDNDNRIHSLAVKTVEHEMIFDKFDRLDETDKQTILLMMDSMLQNDKYKKDTESKAN